MKIFYSTLGIDNAIKEQERDNIKANQKVNNMLNSTKTWEEKFEQEYWGKFGSTKTINDIKQFISELRKKDEEELIKMIDEYFRHLIIIPRPDLTGKKLLQLIQDYYEN